jgi:hypothetical protein
MEVFKNRNHFIRKTGIFKKNETLKHALLEIKSRQLNDRGMEKILL